MHTLLRTWVSVRAFPDCLFDHYDSDKDGLVQEVEISQRNAKQVGIAGCCGCKHGEVTLPRMRVCF